MEKALICWSSGKDSAQALYEVLLAQSYHVVGLLTSVNGDDDRVFLHGVGLKAVRAQASAIGLPLEVIRTPLSLDGYEDYEKDLARLHILHKAKGVTTVIFGDIHHEEVRARREENLSRVGMQAHFPLWGKTPEELVHRFCARGFKAYLCAGSQEHFAPEDMGALMDRAFFAKLPHGVDPSGENGEFHSFVFDGPLFKEPVAVLPAKECTMAHNMIFRDIELAPSALNGVEEH